jgi:FKBP-type peptidyl-prolyl cis-trans isomerase
MMKLRFTAALLSAGLTTTTALFAQDEAAPAKDPAAPAAATETKAPAKDAAAPAKDAAATETKDPAAGTASGTAAPAPPAPPAPPAAPELDPAVLKSNSSYGFGYRSGRQFAQQTSRFGLKINDIERKTFVKGFFEGFAEKDPSIKEDDINAALQALGTSLQEREKAAAAANLEVGKKFLEENGKREGVTTTESGLQYEIIKKGDGAVYQAPAAGAPPANKQFMVHYKGTLIDGTEFDASPEGQTVPMTLQVIPGFKEALTAMPVGSKWKLFIPAGLAYGEQRRSALIQPNSTLVFDLELVNIEDAPAPAQPNFAMPPGAMPPGAMPPGARPQGARPTGRPRAQAVSPPVRVPIPPKNGGDAAGGAPKRPKAVSPPVRVPVKPEGGGAEPKPAPENK